MNETRLMRRPKLQGTLGFYIGAIVLAIGAAWFTYYLNHRRYPFFPAPSDSQAAAALSKAWDAYAAVGNLLTSLATGLVAALGLYACMIRDYVLDAMEVLDPAGTIMKAVKA